MSRVVCLAFAMVLASAPSVQGQDGVDNPSVSILRFEAGFHMGILGRVKGELPAAFGDDRSLSVAPGAYFRADVALGRFVLLRPSVQWRSVKAAGIGGPLDLFSVHLGLGLHYEFDFSPDESVTIEPYLFFMVGADAVDRELIATAVIDEGTSFGPSFGLRLGLVTWVSSRVGLNVAWGFERSDFFPNTVSEGRKHVYLTQMAVDLGVSFRLE